MQIHVVTAFLFNLGVHYTIKTYDFPTAPKFVGRRNNLLNVDFLPYVSGPGATREHTNNVIGRCLISNEVKDNFREQMASIKGKVKYI